MSSVPLCPALKMYMADDVTSLWEATEELLSTEGLPPPYWGFCWPGALLISRWLLDNPELVRGRRVLDFGAGCGIASIAAVKVGAASVLASEIDPLALAAMRLNASLNGVSFDICLGDIMGREPAWNVILAGDVCYERKLAEPLFSWLVAMLGQGIEVYLADPGRAYLPSVGLRKVFSQRVPTSLDLEDAEYRDTTVYELVN